MIDRTRLSVRTVLASALLLAVGAAGSAPVLAADDQTLVRLHSACHHALAEEMRAAQRLKSQNATPEDATRTLAAVDAGLDWNQKACGTIAGRSAQDNAVRKQMHDVNEAFLLSLRGQAETVLGRPSAASSFAQANRELDACAASAKLPANVRSNCRAQIAANGVTQRPGAADANDPCQVALVAANDAGDALKPKDYASFEKAYQRATDGLAANAKCVRSEKMRDVNNAYLSTWKTVAERYLDVPFANPADPFGVPNALFAKCTGWAAPFPAQAKSDCATQLATNQRFVTDFAAQPVLSAGQTARPLGSVPLDWPYALRPDFVWDAGCKNVENAPCADEEVRDGSGSNGWGPAAKNQATPLDDQKERVLFATIRTCDDLGRLFSGHPPQIDCPKLNSDFFKSNILLVAAQRKPHQQCDMTVSNVQSISSPPSAFTPRDGVRVDYTLKCAPPVPGSSGGIVTRVLSIPSRNANGSFGAVTFVELGGAGPRGATQ